jgi:hypothetical protein
MENHPNLTLHQVSQPNAPECWDSFVRQLSLARYRLTRIAVIGPVCDSEVVARMRARERNVPTHDLFEVHS